MKPYTLTNREGESISPMTSTKTVFDSNGADIETRLDEQKQSIESLQKECAKKTEVAQGLATKQDALSDSADITVSADNELSLTDKAKYATFDAQWTAIGGTVVESGKAYSINGGNGSFADAVKAMSYFTEQPRADLSWLCFGKSLKLLPTIIVPNTASVNFSRAFQSLYGIDKVVIKSTLDGGRILAGDMFAAFNSSGVKELDCILDVSNDKNIRPAFVFCRLEKIKLFGLKSNVGFDYANKLSLDSVKYMVTNAANTAAITITLHPDAYARVTEEIFAAAAQKNITIAST